MSDAVHTQSRRRVSQYAGLRSVKYRLKYSGCERVSVRGVRVRKLMSREIAEFTAAVQSSANASVASRHVVSDTISPDPLPMAGVIATIVTAAPL